MENSLEKIRPEHISEFYRHICLAVKKKDQKKEARKELDYHLDQIKQAPKKWILHEKVKELPKKVDKIVNTEKESLGYENQEKVIQQLQEKINYLEGKLSKVKEQRDSAIFENKQQIQQVRSYLSRMRTRMEVFFKAKEKRDKRIKELEQKVIRTARRHDP